MSRVHRISCFVIACNEADRIGRCLQSLAGWVDELIVLDSGSTDGTVEIARQYADQVYQTDWPGFGPQRNRALGYCTHDWVLNIDADEVLTAEAKAEIDQLLAVASPDFNLVKIPWHTWFFGKVLKYGRYSTPQGKLFLKTGAAFKNRQVHESLLLPNEKSKVIKAPIIHYSWRSYQHCQEKHLKYACLLAQHKFAQGKRSRMSFALLRFVTDFIQQFVVRGGFLDGWRGLLMALVLAQYAFHKYAALVALQAEQESRHD